MEKKRFKFSLWDKLVLTVILAPLALFWHPLWLLLVLVWLNWLDVEN